MMIKALLIDDEPLALAQLRRYAEAVPYLEVIASCLSAEESMPYLKDADVLFTDISMPDTSGMDLIRSLDERHAPLVVFTTAYPQYAVEGFQVRAVDYLLKPFGQADFTRAAERVRELLTLRRGSSAPEMLSFKTERKSLSVPLASIRYIASMSEYIRVYRSDAEEPLLVLYSLKNLVPLLPQDRFLRIHRSYIIAVNRVREAGRSRVVLDDGTSLPVGDSYRDAVARKFLLQ